MGKFVKQFSVGVVIYLLVAIVCALLLLRVGVELVANAYNDTSLYQNSVCDFIIPSPGDEQVAELQSETFIEHVEPYYFAQSKVSIKGKSGTENVLMLDSVQNLSMTVYCDARCIQRLDTLSHGAIVDYLFAKQYNVSLGDNITVSFGIHNLEYKVCGIYEKNSVYSDSVVVINWSAEEKQIVASVSASKLTYSGAWVTASDYSACENFLTTEYKPLGRLKDRSSFDSDEAYQLHVDTFNQMSFASEITDFSKTLQSLQSKHAGYAVKANIAFAFAVVIPIMAIFIKTVLVGYDKKQKTLIKKVILANEKKRKTILTYKNAEIISGLLVTSIVYLLFGVIYKATVKQYVNYAIMAVSICVCFVTVAVLVGAIVLVNCNKFKREFATIKRQ